jgi:hypothetical protein
VLSFFLHETGSSATKPKAGKASGLVPKPAIA